MKLLSSKKLIASALCLTASMNALVVQSAMASSITCRDYYSYYVTEATTPTPPPTTIVVVERPHYHGHYPEYHGHHDGGYHEGPSHGHDHGGHDNHGNDDNSDAEMAMLLITTAGLITTSVAEDMKLNDAQQMIRIIDDANMGDGPDLRDFVTKVQANAKASVTKEQVADAVVRSNQNLEFCRAGDLDSVSEFAERIARQLSPSS